MRFILYLLILIAPLGANAHNGYCYDVRFKGVEDEEMLHLLESTSQCVALQDSPPLTSAGLMRRAQDDIPRLIKALQSIACYEAKVDYFIAQGPPAHLLFTVTLGETFPLSSVKILPSEPEGCCFPFANILPADIGLSIGYPAYPADIVEAEDKLLFRLEKNGYPLAKIEKREVLADLKTKEVTVIYHVYSGPLCTFGITEIEGSETVCTEFFQKKLRWGDGEIYNPKAVAKTLNALEASGLFSSIVLTHDEKAQPDGSLPMHICVKEAKHRSVAFGVGYATDLGPGCSAEWEHRNFRGMGEKISMTANLWWIKQEGYIRYLKPDFLIPQQDLIYQIEADHEITKGFTESSVSFSGMIERQWNDYLRTSYGMSYTLLRNSNSNNNGEFNLLKIPMQLLWNRSNGILDPTKGFTLHFKTTPTLQTLKSPFAYCTHLLTLTGYQPLDEERRFVIAGKAVFGSIWGANKRSIPPSERLYAGSDSLLRGYRYLTVSPLGHDHKPIGGRSMMIYSIEARMRVWENFGFVAFYDFGNVYPDTFPELNYKVLQSTGLGIRYHTPVGPLRIDLAFPLNRRPHLDNAFQLYFSIGQAF